MALSRRTIIYKAAGSYTFTTPSDVTSIIVECWGAGGGGTTAVGAGGGGAYAKDTIAVSPSTGYAVVVGASAANTDGADSTFNATSVIAKGGLSGANGGTGGTAAASTGSVKFNGGAGTLGAASTTGGGGAGDITAGSGTNGGSTTGGSGFGNTSVPVSGAGGASTAADQVKGGDGHVKITYLTDVGANYATVVGVSVPNRSTSLSATSRASINMPAGAQAGSLLLLFAMTYTSGGGTEHVLYGNGWTKLGASNNGAATVSVFYKRADGSDITKITSTNGGSLYCYVYNITGAGEPVGAFSSGASGNVDPPDLSPVYGTGNYLWFAVSGYNVNGRGDPRVTAAPTGYELSEIVESTAINSFDGELALAIKYANALSDNPGTFTTSANSSWAGATVAVPYGTIGSSMNYQKENNLRPHPFSPGLAR